MISTLLRLLGLLTLAGVHGLSGPGVEPGQPALDPNALYAYA